MFPARPLICAILILVALPGLTLARAEADTPRRFDVPAEDAAVALKLFAEQSAQEIVYSPDTVRGARSTAVHGRFSPGDALERILAGTDLVATRSPSGLFTVKRQRRPQSPRRPPGAAEGGRPDRRAVSADATVDLDPFEVKADSDKSYGALNSNSLTAFNVELDRMPVTADIFDQAFMNDVGAISVEGAIQAYDAGSQFDGLTTGVVAANQPGDHVGNGSLRLRGSPIGGMQINGLLIAGSLGNPGATSYGASSNYDLERIEIINGPQALLFAGGGAGGVINLVTKQARLGQPEFGSLRFMVDQDGSKYGTLDYGASQGDFAIRIALVDGTNDTRRVNLGDRLVGQYVQLAARWRQTTFRLTLQQSVDTRVDQDYHTLTSSAGDPWFKFNGYNLTYLLATNQAAGILNGHLTWNNAQSLDGVWTGDDEVAEVATVEANSVWTSWLSTHLSIAGGNFNDDQIGGGSTINLYTPGSSSNPIPGNWTIGMPQSGTPVGDDWRPHVNRAVRFDAVLTNELFGGRAKSQTNLDADYTGNLNGLIGYSYYQADGNGNVIVNPAGERTPIPTQAWAVNSGPLLYSPIFNPLTGGTGVQRVTLDGINYVRQKTTPLAGGLNHNFDAGYAAVNYTQWLDGALDSMAGIRLAHQKSVEPGFDSELEMPEFSAGLDYRLLPWLAPFVSASDVWATPASQNPLPNGLTAPNTHGVGEEAGFKLNGAGGKISGSISLYRNDARGEQFSGGNIINYVSPPGLNGAPVTGSNLGATVRTYGVTAAMTAAPTKNWRMRLSAAITDGQFENGIAFGQLYDDQFHENSSGNVTYADGTAVFVPAAFNARQLTVPAGTAGAVPLTTALLSTPGSPYYASPQPVTGAMLNTSNGGLVLLSPPDPAHGSILTGATALPISAYQLNPALSGVAPLGTIQAVQAGDQTWGYPRYSANFTGIYEVPSGWIKGFKIGGTAMVNWRNLAEYFYPNGFTGANFADQRPFYLPFLTRFDLIAGYTRKFGRLTWSTQLNVDNLFNKYHVVIYPDPITGWTVPASLKANFDQQPRACAWTNTIGF